MLKEHGYFVRVALDGNQGVNSATLEAPDVILLDIAMPMINGFEVCRNLKAHPATKHIPVIFISALDEVSDIVEAFHAGGVDYITRPFRTEEVLARIENQLTIQRTRQAFQQRLALETLVTSISTRFIAIPLEEVDAAIQRAIQEIGEFSDVDRCTITLLDDAKQLLTGYYTWQSVQDEAPPLSHKHQGIDFSQFAWSLSQLRQGEVIKVSQIADLPPDAAPEQQYWQQQHIQSLFVMPLILEKTLIGCFSLYWIAKEKQWVDADTRLFRVMGDIFVNVLARKRSEELLKEERDRSQLYLDLAGVLFVALDKNGNVTLINRKGCEVLDYPQEEIIGKHWFTQFVPERFQQVVESVFLDVKQEPTNTYLYFENPVITRNGEERIIAWLNTIVRDEFGYIIGLIGSGSDITERKQAEAALAAEHARFEWVVEHTDQGFLVISEQGNIIYANQQARTHLHIQPQTLSEQPVSFLETVEKYYHCYPEDAWKDWKAWNKVPPLLPEDQQPLRYLVQPETSVSSTLWLHVELITFSRDTTTDYLVCLRNVTEQMTTQRQMWTFHALISHKLNTPMSCLLNSLYLLQDKAKDRSKEEMREFATIAYNSAQRLHNQFRSIRHFLTTPNLAHPGNECRLQAIPQLITALCADVEIKTISISAIPEHDPQLRTALSEQAVNLLLRQVLENAHKFHPQHNPVIEITLSLRAEEGLCLQVYDDGVTLSSDQLARVWAPYYQAERGFSGQVPGMGLGLAMVAMLLWSVGGSYHIYNRDPGPGVVVELVIPLIQRPYYYHIPLNEAHTEG